MPLYINGKEVQSSVLTETSAIKAETTLIHAETTQIHAETTLIHGETTLIHGETTLIHAETTQIHVETSHINKILGSSAAATNTTGITGRIALIHKETSDILGETTLIHAETSHINKLLGSSAAATNTTGITGRIALIHKETSALGPKMTSVNNIIGDANAATNTTSIGGRVNNINGIATALNAYAFARTEVMPTGAVPVAVSANKETVWDPSSGFYTICNTGVITSAYQITGILAEACATGGVYEVLIYDYKGGSHTYAARCRINGSTLAGVPGQFVPMQSPIYVGGHAITAKCAAATTSAQISISVQYRVV